MTVSMGKASREGEVRAMHRGRRADISARLDGQSARHRVRRALHRAELDELGPRVSRSRCAGGSNVEIVRAPGPAPST